MVNLNLQTINEDWVANMDIVLDIFRFAVGCYFVYSGSTKFGDPSKFWVAIMEYKLFPIKLARLGAAAIPSIEFMAGLLFAAGLLHKYVGSILVSMLLFFSISLLFATMRGNYSNCGCGGFQEMAIGWRPIVRNLFLILGVVLGILSQGNQGNSTFILVGIAAGCVLISTMARLRELKK